MPKKNIKSICDCAFEYLESRRLLSSVAASHDDAVPGVENYFLDTQFLSVSAAGQARRVNIAPEQVAMDYLRDHAGTFGLVAADFDSAEITNAVPLPSTGATAIYLRQTYNGLPITNAVMNINVDRDGRVFSVGGAFVPGLTARQNGIGAAKRSASQALRETAGIVQLNSKARIDVVAAARASNQLTQLSAPELSIDPIDAKLVYVARADGVHLAWNFILNVPGGDHWYDVSLDDRSGQLIFGDDYVDHVESYNVYALPTESPADGARSIVTNANDLTASPFGWQDTNGVAGAELTYTRGNNVNAYTDTDANNVADTGSQPDGGATTTFNFPLDLSQAPSAYRPAAVTNLYYWNNVNHDIHYKYGFTEAAGNFQTNNYGRGGTANDEVQAEAQDGGGLNNANFATPADGSKPRMQMYLWNSTTPGRDGALDTGVITHEYGHGVSNRLTGGPANASALASTQSGGMGEGWSDFFALMFTQRSGDVVDQSYPMGNYVVGQPINGTGIRRYPYSFNKSINPLTFDAYGLTGVTAFGTSRDTEVHRSGELWCATLWDLNWLLINKYGYDSNLYTGYTAAAGPGHAGNKLALQLVENALKLQPANPSFTQARDAILLADQNLTGGANAKEIWIAFARRGLGFSTVDSSASATTITSASDLPISIAASTDPFVSASNPTKRLYVQPISQIVFTFDQSMAAGSFDATDVVSFTGPGGVDLRNTITGVVQSGPSTFVVSFSAVAAEGTYSMTIGPGILASDDGHAMDQDMDGIAGESVDDVYVASFTYTKHLGPEGYGYQASAYPYENLNLVIGSAGVTTALNASDDGNGTITLPAGNTFNFYGRTVTSLSVNANGLLVLDGAAFTDNPASNTGLTTRPTNSTIAVLWDDWRTDANGTGGTDSAVLWQLDAANSRLIIEWSDVPNFDVSGGTAATFQAILQLNTGAVPGRIILNYPDAAVGNTNYDNGGSSTTGIKDVNFQGANRLIVSQNDNAFPWISSNRAVLLALDATAPVVSTANYLYETANQVALTFSENVGASLASSDLTLANLDTGETIALTPGMLAYDTLTNTATLTLSDLLPNGDYRLTVAAAGVTDAAGNRLDGNNDGLQGDAYTLDFYVLAGDVNRDRVVSFDDLLVLAQHYGQTGQTFSQGNINYSADGLVGFDDLLILAQQYGTSVVAAPSVRAFGTKASQNRNMIVDI